MFYRKEYRTVWNHMDSTGKWSFLIPFLFLDTGGTPAVAVIKWFILELICEFSFRKDLQTPDSHLRLLLKTEPQIWGKQQRSSDPFSLNNSSFLAFINMCEYIAAYFDQKLALTSSSSVLVDAYKHGVQYLLQTFKVLFSTSKKMLFHLFIIVSAACKNVTVDVNVTYYSWCEERPYWKQVVGIAPSLAVGSPTSEVIFPTFNFHLG